MAVQTDTRGRESDGSTRVKVSDPVADELYKRKRRKETYEDVEELRAAIVAQGGYRSGNARVWQITDSERESEDED